MSNKKLSDRLKHNGNPFEPSGVTYKNDGGLHHAYRILEEIRTLESENERLRRETFEELRDGILVQANKECDALRAKNEELHMAKRSLLREQSGHIEECKALRAEVERLKNVDKPYEKLIAERDALRAELKETRLSLRTEKAAVVESENVRAAEMGVYSERQSVKHFQHERDEARAELAGWKRETLSSLTVAIDERDEARAELAKAVTMRDTYAYELRAREKFDSVAEINRLRTERDEARAELDRLHANDKAQDETNVSYIKQRNAAIAERNAALDKLERVGEWVSKDDCTFLFRVLKIQEILGARETYAEGQESAEPASAPPQTGHNCCAHCWNDGEIREPRESVMRPRANSRVFQRMVQLKKGEGTLPGPFVMSIENLPSCAKLLAVHPMDANDKMLVYVDMVAWDIEDWRRFTHHYAFTSAEDGHFPMASHGKAIVLSEPVMCDLPAGRFYVFEFKQTVADPDNIKRKPHADDA